MKNLFTAVFIAISAVAFGQTYSATDSVIINNTNMSGFGDNSRGFEFTANTDLNLTHLGYRLPDSAGVYTWTIWETNSQAMIHQQVSTLPADTGWLYEPISTPITLNSGVNYILILNQQGPAAGYYYQSGVTQVNFNLTYSQVRYCNSCGPNDFPTGTLANYHYGVPDFLFTTCLNTSSSDSLTVVDSYTWPINGQTYTTSGTYVDTIPNAAGCDSIITLNLTVEYTGLEEHSAASANVYPNPATEELNISVSPELIGKEYIILSLQGKELLKGKLKEEEVTLDISNFAPGIYVIQIEDYLKQDLKIIKD
jgi:hypothetical protein